MLFNITNNSYQHSICILYQLDALSWFQGFNGADLRNVCTEAGMFAIRAERDYVVQEDFMKVNESSNYKWFHI